MNRFFSLLFGVAIIVAGMNDPCHAGRSSFHDNFNKGDADGWIYASRDGRVNDPASSWSVVDGRLLEDSGYDAQMALVENIPFKSQTLVVQADILAWAGIILWYKDLNNYIAMGSYGSGAAIYVGEYFNGIASGGTYPHIGSPSVSPIYEFKVDANSETGNIDFYVNGLYQFTYTAQTNVRTGLSGLVGRNGGGYFDNFEVTSLKSPPPRHPPR